MAGNVRQHKFAEGNGGSAVALTFDVTPVAGNTIAVFIGQYDGTIGATGSVVDNKSNSYAIPSGASNTLTNVSRSAWYVAQSIAASATFTVTYTPSNGTGAFYDVCIVELEGVETASVDKTGSGNGTSTTPTSSSTGVLAQADEIVLIGEHHDTGSNLSSTPNGGFTTVDEFEDGSSGNTFNVAQLVVSATTALAPTWTIGGSVPWTCAVVTFKASAGGGVSGTVAQTLAAFVAAASGTFTGPVPNTPSIAGTHGGSNATEVVITPGADNGVAVTSYTVDWALNSAPTSWLGPASPSANLTQYISGLTPGTAYVFRVKATNANGDSAWSSTSGSITPADTTGFESTMTADKTLTMNSDKTLQMAGAGGITGTVASTLGSFTSSASGTATAPPVSGTVAVTLGSFVAAASGTNTVPPITGTVSVTLGSFTSTAAGSTFTGRYPVSTSNRKLIDQTGNVYLLKCMSSWGMAQNLTTAQITTALNDIAGLGFNAVSVAMFGNYYGGDWDRYHDIDGNAAFSGSPYASSLGSAWGKFDWIISEAARLGMTVLMSLYTGFGTVGCEADLISAGTTNAYNFGVNVATRYASAANVLWHVGADDNWTFGNGPYAEVDAVFHGIKDTEGSTHRLIMSEPNNGDTVYNQWGLTGSTSFTYFINSIDSIYNYGGSAVAQFDAVYDDQTTYPLWDCEPPYVGAPHYSGTEYQQLRERNYATFLRNGVGINFGHEDWWPFGKTGIYTAGIAWTAVAASTPLVQAGHAWTILDSFVDDTTWAPDNATTPTLLTSGAGTGDTKAAAGFSDTAALVYFPSSRGSIVVATSVLTGTAFVRLRWYDPTNGTYTSISVSEAQSGSRAITYPTSNSNSAGQDDWVLVVDIDPTAITGTVAQTLGAVTASASGTYTPPAFTGTVAQTLSAVTAAAAGTYTPPPVTGTVAVTLDAVTSTAAGTFTLPPVTGTVAQTIGAVTSAASGTSTPPAITGTVAVTLDAVTSSASGASSGGAVTGTVSVTLDAVTAAGSGTYTPPPVTGTSSTTLGAVTASAAGTVTPPSFTGTVNVTLASVAVSASGTVTPPSVTGTTSTTLDPIVSSATGTSTPPARTGTVAVTLDAVTSTAAGTSAGPGAILGTVAVTLGAVTCTATGTRTIPGITGTVSVTLGPLTSQSTSQVRPTITGELVTVALDTPRTTTALGTERTTEAIT